MKLFHIDKKFRRFEDISPDLLKKEKVKLLLCDLDNTIRLHSEKKPTTNLIKWASDCQKAGTKIIIVSNNGRKKFMQKFCEPMGVSCVWWAGKPMSRKLTSTMREHEVTPEHTVMLGDKWTTDVIAANLAGVRAWKVDHRRDL